ncbi:MAG: 4Fe-4S binding protein [Hadesarchaea archaeon]|nr:4Fe-4S binding protein [Hadesarchaea archaeon]
MVDLSANLCGLELRNPIMPAAGPTSRDGNTLVEAANNGAGGLVSKTVSTKPAEVPRPNMAKVKNGLLNCETWSEIPLKQWLNEEYPKAKKSGLPLIASIGYNAEEIGEIAPQVVEAGADALELSTHYLGHDPSPVVESVKAAKEQVDVPILVKLSPHVLDITEFASAAEEAGADGIVAINTVGPCLSIDVNTGHPVLGSENGYGWLSGPAIKPLALRCVADIARTVDIPVVGVGGINKERDVVEFIMAGATAVELCTAAITRGAKVYGLIADGLTKFMKSKQYDSIEEFRGEALKHMPDEPLRTKSKPPEVLKSRCTGCGLCAKHCPFGAVKIVGGKAKIDPTKCTGCGLCVSVCPVRALRF